MNTSDDWNSVPKDLDLRLEVRMLEKACESIADKIEVDEMPSDLKLGFFEIREALQTFKQTVDMKSTIPSKLEALAFAADQFSARALRNRAYSEPLYKELKDIQRLADIIASAVVNMHGTGDESRGDLRASIRLLTSQVREFDERVQKTDEAISSSASKLAEQMENATTHINSSTLENNKKIDDEIKSITATFTEAITRLRGYEKEINGIRSKVAEGALTKEYIGNSIREQRTADNLRMISLALMVGPMVFTGLIVANSLDFTLQSLLSKLSLLLVWLIPATYTARESAKHRTQQNLHKQVALDLKASAPYLATLPKHMQDKVRIEIASNIFFNKTPTSAEKDPSPINMQELISKLIDKLELKGK